MDVSELYRADGDDAVVVAVHVIPGAGRAAVVGRHGAALKVRVAAPPEGGRANDATVSLLAETFGVPPGSVELVGGGTSRAKRFRVAGVEPDDFRRQLEQSVGGGPRPPRGTAR